MRHPRRKAPAFVHGIVCNSFHTALSTIITAAATLIYCRHRGNFFFSVTSSSVGFLDLLLLCTYTLYTAPSPRFTPLVTQLVYIRVQIIMYTVCFLFSHPHHLKVILRALVWLITKRRTVYIIILYIIMYIRARSRSDGLFREAFAGWGRILYDRDSRRIKLLYIFSPSTNTL